MSYLPDKLFPLSVPDAPVEAVRFTPDLRGLIAWLETQDAATVYDEADYRDCILCRFFSVVAGKPQTFSQVYRRPNYEQFGPIHFEGVAVHTYAEAAARARKMLAGQQI